jgi:hypothetical protein
MKKLIWFVVLLILMNCSGTGYRSVSRRSNIDFKVNRKAGTTVYRHRNLEDSPLQYRIVKGKDKHLLMDVVYLSNGWLFFDTVLIVGNGEKIAFTDISEQDKQTEIHTGVISEIYTVPCKDIEKMEALVSGDDLRMKIKGKEEKMYIIPGHQRKALLEMVEFYKDLDH